VNSDSEGQFLPAKPSQFWPSLCLSVCLSVCHTGGSVKNSAS